MGDESEKWLKHYSSDHQMLLVGEGDFSFSLCLARSFGLAFNIVASSLDSYDDVIKKYKEEKSNLMSLRVLEADVLHGVDPTTMRHHTDLKHRRFDRIIFNFPHTGFQGKEDETRVILKHKSLVQSFFSNAKGMLRPDGEIHVTHKTSHPFNLWNLEGQVLSNSLVLTRQVDFMIEDYPSYKLKRGDGRRCDEAFPLGEASTFMFQLSARLYKEQGTAVERGNGVLAVTGFETDPEGTDDQATAEETISSESPPMAPCVPDGGESGEAHPRNKRFRGRSKIGIIQSSRARRQEPSLPFKTIFHYNQNQPIFKDSPASAALLRQIQHPAAQLSPVRFLAQPGQYRQLSASLTKVIADANQMVYSYEEKLREGRKENQDSEDFASRVQSLEESIQKIEAENARLESRLTESEAELESSNNLRDELLGSEAELKRKLEVAKISISELIKQKGESAVAIVRVKERLEAELVKAQASRVELARIQGQYESLRRSFDEEVSKKVGMTFEVKPKVIEMEYT